jgi:hypothetical protein
MARVRTLSHGRWILATASQLQQSTYKFISVLPPVTRSTKCFLSSEISYHKLYAFKSSHFFLPSFTLFKNVNINKYIALLFFFFNVGVRLGHIKWSLYFSGGGGGGVGFVGELNAEEDI